MNGDRKVDVDRIVRHWQALLSDAVGRYASYASRITQDIRCSDPSILYFCDKLSSFEMKYFHQL